MAALLLLLPLALLACQRAEPARRWPIEVKDDLGRVVRLGAPARAIASLSPSNTEILFSLGCGARVILRDRASSYPPEAQHLPAVSAFQLSPEHLAGFHPDLVLVSHLDLHRLRALQAAGLVAASFDPRTLEALYENLRAIGELCGATARAATLIGELRARAGRVKAAVRGRPRPRVYIEIDGSNPHRPWVAGPGSFPDHLLWLAGGRNFIHRLSRPVAPINAEEVLAARPEVILLANTEGDQRTGRRRLGERPGWSGLQAVREGRIIENIHRDLLSRPGPRALDGLEALAAALHPRAFEP